MKSRLFFRLEHSISGLGPYEHRLEDGTQSLIVNKLPFHRDPNSFEEFNIWLKQKSYLKLPKKFVFGWSTYAALLNFVDKIEFPNNDSFKIVILSSSDFLELPDGQVVFLKV